MKKIDTWLGIQRYISEAARAVEPERIAIENFEVVAKTARDHKTVRHRPLSLFRTKRSKRFLKAFTHNI